MSYGLLSPRSLAGQLVGGGVSGAIVTVIVGMIMNAMKSAARRLLPPSEAVDLPVQPTHASLSKGLRARAACPLWVISGHLTLRFPVNVRIGFGHRLTGRSTSAKWRVGEVRSGSLP